jgi:prepilin-type N-terminal cleavage/methylation domain-containing protein
MTNRNLNNKAFTIVEVLVTIVLVTIVTFAGYRLFTSSYFFVRTSEDKLQNVHAVSVLMEGLRYELSSLPDFNNFGDSASFLAEKGNWITKFSYNKVKWDEGVTADDAQAKSNINFQKLSNIEYKFDKDKKEVVKSLDGAIQKFGRGRIEDFGIRHNYDPKNPEFPVYFLIKIKTIDQNFSKVEVQYTIYPRVLNKNLQLKEKEF